MSRIKVRITLSIELDADAWAEYQGCDRAEVRDNVADHVLYNVQGSAFLEEAQATVELKGRN